MKIIISGKGMEVSDYLKGLVEKKAGKLKRYFKEDAELYVTLSIEKSRHIAEVTVPIDGVVLRTQEVSGDMYASIDASLKKLERQMRKHRTRLEKRIHEGAFDELPLYGEDVDDFDSASPRVVRTKRFPVKPMDINEAAEQMELLEHNFFVFVNSGTGDVNVLYKRWDGDLGLIEPDYK